MTSARKTHYPGKVAIRRAVESARTLGLDVCGFEVGPDGVIKIMDRSVIPQQSEDEFDKWDRAGKLG